MTTNTMTIERIERMTSAIEAASYDILNVRRTLDAALQNLDLHDHLAAPNLAQAASMIVLCTQALERVESTLTAHNNDVDMLQLIKDTDDGSPSAIAFRDALLALSEKRS